jgi:hypothetical protein
MDAVLAMAMISLAALRVAASTLVSSANQAARDRHAASAATRRAWLGLGALLALAVVCVVLAVRNPQPIVAAVAAFGT